MERQLKQLDINYTSINLIFFFTKISLKTYVQLGHVLSHAFIFFIIVKDEQLLIKRNYHILRNTIGIHYLS